MSELTFREKQLYWRLVPNALVAVGLAALLFFGARGHGVTVFGLIGLYYVGTAGESLYIMYFATDTRTDERDRTLELRATRSAYAFLSASIFLIIWFSAVESVDASALPLMLFGAWLLSRIVRDAAELRLHRGHEGLWPDVLVDGMRRRRRARFERAIALIEAREQGPREGDRT